MAGESRSLASMILLTVLCWYFSLSEAKIPVILVPGDGGSQFLGKLNKSTGPHEYCVQKTSYYFDLWLNLEELLPGVIDCFVDNMRLLYDRKTRKTRNQVGVDIMIPDFGNTSSVEWLDKSHLSATSYFAPIVNALVKKGYKRGFDVRGAPYDFRKAPNEFEEFYKNLTWLVEDTYKKNKNQKVAILAHSMGNPTVLYFLNDKPQAWKDKYIRFFITLSGVWGGAVKPLRLFASGDSLNVPFMKALNVRDEQRSMPSTAFLLPSDKFWNKTEVLVQQPKRNYTAFDYKEFFEDLKLPDAYLMRQDTEKLVYDLKPPGVEVFCFHGINMTTPGKLVYDAGMWPDTQPKVIPDNGDGTVNIRSLHGCLSWIPKQNKPVHHKEFPGVEHTEILGDAKVLDNVMEILLGS